MTEFKIEITPSLPEAGGCRTTFGDISARYKEIKEAFPEKFQIIYCVGGDIFTYYPTSIFNVFADIIQDLDQFEAAKSHYVSVVGYDVAYARCQSGRVWFYDPADVLGVEDQIEVEGDGIPLHLVIEAFERAANDVWDFINSKVKLES